MTSFDGETGRPGMGSRKMRLVEHWFRHDGALPPEMAAQVERRLAGRTLIRILDAGCGATSRVFVGAPSYRVGIDASAEEIAQNRAIDEPIVEPLETAAIAENSFDLVVCWDVLEHLEDPLATLDRLIRSLTLGGILVLALPNVASIKAHLARLTPHVVHRAVFRWLYPRARTFGDHGPFETVLANKLALDQLVSYVAARGIIIDGIVTYESAMQRKARSKIHLGDSAWRKVSSTVERASGGRLDLLRSDIILVLRRPGPSDVGA